MAEQKLLFNIQEKGASKVKGAMGGVTSSIKSMVLAGASIYTLKKAMDATVGAAVKQEQIFRKLQTSIELTGKNYDQLKGEIDNTFASLQSMTEFGDTESAEALTTLVQLTGDYKKSIDQLPLVLDMASTGLFDMSTASRYVAMALEGNAEALGRYIPQLRAANNEIIKNGTAAEKAEEAMRILNEKFGGSAQKNLDSTASSWKQFKNYLEDAREEIGDYLLPVLTQLSRSFTSLITPQETINRILDEVTGEFTRFGRSVRNSGVMVSEKETKIKSLAKELDALRLEYESGNLSIGEYRNQSIAAIKTFQDAEPELKNYQKNLDDVERAISDLAKTTKDGLIGYEQFNDKIADIAVDMLTGKINTEQFNRSIQSQIELLESLNAVVEGSKSIYSEMGDLSPIPGGIGPEEIEMIREHYIDLANTYAGAFSTAIGSVSNAFNAWYQVDVQKAKKVEQEKLKALEDRYKKGSISEQRYQADRQAILDEAERAESARRKKLKPLMIGQATANVALGVTQALATYAPPLSIIMAGLVAAAGAVEIAAINAQQFASGGIVDGPYTTGDRQIARVNSGEMVLNKEQQTELFKIANGGGGGGVNITINGDFIGTEENADRLAEIITQRSIKGFNRIATR